MAVKLPDHDVTQKVFSTPLITFYARLLRLLRDHPSIPMEQAGHELGVRLRTVQRAIQTLEQDGRLVVQKDFKPYTYEVEHQTLVDLETLDHLES